MVAFSVAQLKALVKLFKIAEVSNDADMEAKLAERDSTRCATPQMPSNGQSVNY